MDDCRLSFIGCGTRITASFFNDIRTSAWGGGDLGYDAGVVEIGLLG